MSVRGVILWLEHSLSHYAEREGIGLPVSSLVVEILKPFMRRHMAALVNRFGGFNVDIIMLTITDPIVDGLRVQERNIQCIL